MLTDTLHHAPAPFTGTEIHTLPNGFRIILKEDRTVPVVSMQAWARCGAIDEAPEIYGISHGLEHMVFKGTPTRSAGDVSRAIESQGGAINAATQLESTHYYVDVPSYGADAALTVLADTILNPTFPADELEREKQVIIEEINRRDDSPDATLWDEFASSLFTGTAYAIKVIGSRETVSALTSERLHDYYRTFYVPQNQTFVVAGDFDKGAVLGKLKNLFGGLERREAPAGPKVDLKGWAATKNRFKRNVQMTYMAAGLPTVGITSPDIVALDILSDIIGGGSSSRLNQRLREETQTALSAFCDYIPFRQSGILGFFVDATPAKADRALDELMGEITRLAKKPVRNDELARAKARTKSDWLMGSETPRGQASTLGSLAVLDSIDLISSYLAKVDALSIGDIMAAYETHLAGKRLSLTRIDPEPS